MRPPPSLRRFGSLLGGGGNWRPRGGGGGGNRDGNNSRFGRGREPLARQDGNRASAVGINSSGRQDHLDPFEVVAVSGRDGPKASRVQEENHRHQSKHRRHDDEPAARRAPGEGLMDDYYSSMGPRPGGTDSTTASIPNEDGKRGRNPRKPLVAGAVTNISSAVGRVVGGATQREPKLKSCRTIDELVRVTYCWSTQCGGSPKSGFIAACWSCLSKLLTPEHRPLDPESEPQIRNQLEVMYSCTMVALTSYSNVGSTNLCTIAYSTGKIIKTIGDGTPGGGSTSYQIFGDVLIGERGMERKADTFRSIADAAIEGLRKRHFDHQGLSNLSLAFAYASVNPAVQGRSIFEHLADAILGSSVIKDFTTQELANIVWAFATMGVRRTDLFNAVANRVVRRSLNGFNNQELTMIVWAFAKLQLDLTPEITDLIGALTNVITLRLGSRSNDFITQDLANIASAFAKLQVTEITDLIGALATVITLRLGSQSNDFTTQNLANIAWAYGELYESVSGSAADNIFLAVVEEAIKRNLQDFAPVGLSMMMSAFVKTTSSALADIRLLGMIAEQVRNDCDSFDYRMLQDIGQGLAAAMALDETVFSDLLDVSHPAICKIALKYGGCWGAFPTKEEKVLKFLLADLDDSEEGDEYVDYGPGDGDAVEESNEDVSDLVVFTLWSCHSSATNPTPLPNPPPPLLCRPPPLSSEY